MKSLISVAAGILVGVVVLSLVEKIGNSLLLTTMGIEPISASGATALAITRPTESLLVLLLAYVLGPVAGGYVAGRLAPSRPYAPAAAVGGFVLFLGVTALVLFPHPVWFAAAIVLAVIPAALAGAGLSRV